MSFYFLLTASDWIRRAGVSLSPAVAGRRRDDSKHELAQHLLLPGIACGQPAGLKSSSRSRQKTHPKSGCFLFRRDFTMDCFRAKIWAIKEAKIRL